jgi:hypothetical protein
MRSDLVFGALKYVPNRFLLTKLAAKAIREFHKPNTRISETTNDVLTRFSRAQPMADESHISRPSAVRIDRRRGVPERAGAVSKVKRAIPAGPDQLAETA